MTPDRTILLHGFKLSGHSHRAEAMLRLLDLPFAYHEVDLRGGEQRTAGFLALNPFGTVPVLEDGGVVVADSAAIIVYLALRYDPARRWLPADPVEAAEVQRWLSVAQGPVYNGPAVARMIRLFGMRRDHALAVSIARDLLRVMDGTLASRAYLAGPRPTLADVAVYGYVARAPEGDVPLDDYAQVRAWLDRVEAIPGFPPMPVA